MSVKEERPPHVAPTTVGDLIRALQEYPEHVAVAVRTGTRAPGTEDEGQPIVRPLTVEPHGNRNGPYITL